MVIMGEQGQRGNSSGEKQESPAATVSEEVIQNSHHSTAEVNKLKEMLMQRNNEISILWRVTTSSLYCILFSFFSYIIIGD